MDMNAILTAIDAEIETLQRARMQLTSERRTQAAPAAAVERGGKRRLSAAARRHMAEAQRRRRAADRAAHESTAAAPAIKPVKEAVAAPRIAAPALAQNTRPGKSVGKAATAGETKKAAEKKSPARKTREAAAAEPVPF